MEVLRGGFRESVWLCLIQVYEVSGTKKVQIYLGGEDILLLWTQFFNCRTFLLGPPLDFVECLLPKKMLGYSDWCLCWGVVRSLTCSTPRINPFVVKTYKCIKIRPNAMESPPRILCPWNLSWLHGYSLKSTIRQSYADLKCWNFKNLNLLTLAPIKLD